LIKDAEFRDNPPNPNFRPGRPPHEALLPLYSTDRPEGNHDRPRVASRVGQVQARVAAMLLLTLRGTPTLYYGDEIGMQGRHCARSGTRSL
jgi:glycosidase